MKSTLLVVVFCHILKLCAFIVSQRIIYEYNLSKNWLNPPLSYWFERAYYFYTRCEDFLVDWLVDCRVCKCDLQHNKGIYVLETAPSRCLPLLIPLHHWFILHPVVPYIFITTNVYHGYHFIKTSICRSFHNIRV